MTKLFLIAAMAGALVAQERGGGARGGGVIVLENATLADGQGRIDARKIVLNGQTMEFVTGVMQGPVVKNAPYAAEAVTEKIQKLFDGNQIVQTSTAKLYRDSEGRERREEGMGAILITDPVANVRYTLRPETKMAERQSRGTQRIALTTTLNGVRQALTTVGGAGGGDLTSLPLISLRVGGGEAKEEDLGARTIEGVQAQGTRTTRVIPAGDIGNVRPIEIVDERWYSPELQMTVMTRHSDPREGETVYRLTNIQRIEQVRSLFEVPADYQLRITPLPAAVGGARKGK